MENENKENIVPETESVKNENVVKPSGDAEEEVDIPELSEQEKEEMSKNAENLLAEGRRDFLCNDIEKAVQNLAEACEILTIMYGDRGLETANGYFWYGKALWELCRNQNDFLGSKAENEDVKQDDQEVQEATDEMKSTSISKPLEKIDENQEKETLGEDEDDEEEDVDDAQLAYEMFELCRSIYQEVEEKSEDQKCKIADCYLMIGEITAENGQLEEAISEYTFALDILKELYSDNHRRTAEVYFTLGCAHDGIYQFSKSKECFTKAITGLETRLVELEKIDITERKHADKKDITAIKNTILPELKNRLADALESEKKHNADKEMLKQVLLQKSTTTAFDQIPESAQKSAPVTSINHLVKRKRKPDAKLEESDSKKAYN